MTRLLRRGAPLLLTLGLLQGTGCASLSVTELQKTTQSPSNVAVYFKVLGDKGEPTPGLTAESFNIYEDGALVSSFESQQTILNPEVAASHATLLLVDMSGSVAGSDGLKYVDEATNKFASLLQANNRVAVYAFDGDEKLHMVRPFADAGEGASIDLSSVEADDPSTNLHGAIVEGVKLLNKELEQAKTPLRFGTLVVFTDGTDRAHRVPKEDMLTALQDVDFDVFAIALGNEISDEQLREIGRTGTVKAEDAAAIDKAFEEVAEKVEGLTKSYYLLSYCSPSRAGDHEIQIEAVTRNAKGKEAAKGRMVSSFSAKGFEKGCDPSTPPNFDMTAGEDVGKTVKRGRGGKSGGAKAKAGSGSAGASAAAAR